jgi:hypothetical protein
LAGGNGGDDAPFHDFVAEFVGRPVRDWPPTVLRWLARHRQDRGHFFGGELTGTAAARQVAEELFDGLDQDALRLAAFHHDQAVELIGPPTTPNAHRMAFASHALGDLLAV